MITKRTRAASRNLLEVCHARKKERKPANFFLIEKVSVLYGKIISIDILGPSYSFLIAQYLSEYLLDPINCFRRFFATGSMTKGWAVCFFPRKNSFFSKCSVFNDLLSITEMNLKFPHYLSKHISEPEKLFAFVCHTQIFEKKSQNLLFTGKKFFFEITEFPLATWVLLKGSYNSQNDCYNNLCSLINCCLGSVMLGIRRNNCALSFIVVKLPFSSKRCSYRPFISLKNDHINCMKIVKKNFVDP